MSNWRVKIFIATTVAIISLSIFGIVRAAYNPQINYQGKLTNSSDVAVADGTYNMQFKLCTDVACAGTIWTEARTGADVVQVTNGLFSVMLGSVSTTLDTINFNQNLYLEFSVSTNTINWETLLPRKQLGTVPSAFEAAKLGGLASSSYAKIATPETISGAWTFNNILSITANSVSPALNILQSGAGTGLSVGNGTATTTIFGGATSTFPYGATFATTGGNVGIGTTTANSKLTIQGSGATSASAALSITNSVGTSTLYVRDDGKVSIGTTTIDSLSMLSVVKSDNTNQGLARILVHNPSLTGSFAVYEMRVGTSSGGMFFGSNTAVVGSGIVNGVSFRANVGQDVGLSIQNQNPALIVQGTTNRVGIAAYNPTLYYWPQFLASGLTIGNGGTSQLPTAGTLTPVVRIVGANNSTADNTILRLVRETAAAAYYGSAVDFKLKSYGPGGNPFAPDTQFTISLKNSKSFIENADVDVITFRDNGFVGIGTTAPSTTLHVVTTTEQLRLGYNGANYTSFTVGTNGAITIASTNSATTTITNGLVVNTNSLVVNKSTGYVGIGNTSPSYQLSVTGDINTTGALRINGNDLSQYFVTTTGNYGEVWMSDAVGAGVWTPTSSLGIGGGTGISGSGVVGRLAYFSAADTLTSTSTLYWDSTNGRLGVGTSAPSQKLHITDGTFLIDTPTNPTIVGSLTDTTNYITGAIMAVSGKYAFTVSQIVEFSSLKGMLIVTDVSNPTKPVIAATSTGGLSQNININSISVVGKNAYLLGSNSTGDTQFNVFDISDPISPSPLGSIDNSLPSNLKSIHMSGQYAYAVSGNSSTGTLSIIDINNGDSPAVVGAVDSFSQSFLAHVNSVFVSGKYAYMTIGTSTIPSVTTGTIIKKDISSPSLTINISNNNLIRNSSEQSILAGVNDIFVSGRYAYVSISNATTGTVAIIDVSASNGFDNNTNYIKGYVSSTADQTLLVGANSIQVFGNYAYVTASSSLVVVDISSTTAPYVIGSISNSSLKNISSFYIAGKYIYTVNSTDGIFNVIDIKGADIYAANVGVMSVNALTVFEAGEFGSLSVQNSLSAGSLNVGSGGIASNGKMIVDVDSSFSSMDSNYAFSVTKSGTQYPWFYINGNGNVSINATTTPTDSDSGYKKYKMYINSGNDTDPGLAVRGFIRATGFISGTSSFDLAETYPINLACKLNNSCPVEGDIVCSDPTIVAGVKKCKFENRDNIIGIVSTNPGFLLGGADFNDLMSTSTNKAKVALAGRVPTKVSIMYGEIKVGDKLTISTIDGVAAKAIGEVPVVSMAMENYSGTEVGSIITFVDLGWQNELYKALTLDTSNSTLTFGSENLPYNLLLNGSLNIFKEKIQTFALSQDGAMMLSGGTSVNLSLSNITNTSTGIYFDNNGGIGFVTKGEERMKIDADGNVIIDVIVANRHVVAEKYNLVQNCESNNSCPKINEIVCLMVTSTNFTTNTVSYCENNYGENQVGVVLKSANLVFSSTTPVSNSVLVITSGRAKVKVSSINGEIKVGDYLTTATSGVAVKAIEPGKVLGTALENFNGAENREIEISVDPQFALGYLDSEGDLAINSSTPYASNLVDKFTLAIKYSLKKLGLTIQNGIANLKEIFVEKVTTENLCVGSTCVNEEQLKQLLETAGQTLQNIPLAPTGSIPDPLLDTVLETPSTTPSTDTPSNFIPPPSSDPAPLVEDIIPIPPAEIPPISAPEIPPVE
ncbi:MAG: hypothetical protein WCV83_03275 [Candidatus Magasanikbacteria bacterium]|jgi:hypothetical protein